MTALHHIYIYIYFKCVYTHTSFSLLIGTIKNDVSDSSDSYIRLGFWTRPGRLSPVERGFPWWYYRP